ncbi:MAG: non-canonical purine NTP pyrophosphatase [Candidatus Hodarchaeales archaeon]
MNNSVKNSSFLFVSTNIRKYEEIREIFRELWEIRVSYRNFELLEIQSDNLEEIAEFSLRSCPLFQKKISYFVEDSGIFIKHLNGFPGPYSSYIFKTLGLDGILTLLNNVKDREAYFQSSIALYFDRRILTFSAKVFGSISNEKQGKGWGYDPIFIPEKSRGRTYSELGLRKNYLSHRFLVVKKMIEHLKVNYSDQF